MYGGMDADHDGHMPPECMEGMDAGMMAHMPPEAMQDGCWSLG